MKIAQVFNRYRTEYGGEFAVVEQTARLLVANGHEVLSVEKSSESIRTPYQKFLAFGKSIYSISARKEFDRFLRRHQPDVVHVHNLFPLFSPSILIAAKSVGVPAVITVHNQLMTCPIGTHYSHGLVCERCKKGSAAWCILRNCAESVPKSINYTLRFALSRQLGLLSNNVEHFIVQTSEAATDLQEVGISIDQISVAPSGIPIPETVTNPRVGGFCLFVGRLVRQKGAGLLVRAAAAVPDIPIVIVGDGPEEKRLSQTAPPNVRFCGRLDRTQLETLYRKARIVVFPSQAYESLGLVVLEALSHGVPVLASRIRGPNSIIEDGETGVFFESGSATDLSSKLKVMWDQPDQCHTLGMAGRAMVSRHYSETAYYERLIRVYEGVLEKTEHQ